MQRSSLPSHSTPKEKRNKKKMKKKKKWQKLESERIFLFNAWPQRRTATAYSPS
jgi:hypothetical protein